MVADIGYEPKSSSQAEHRRTFGRGTPRGSHVSFMDDDDTEAQQNSNLEWGAVENKVEAKYSDVLDAVRGVTRTLSVARLHKRNALKRNNS